jgi:dTDP-4-amino-4,6-dideoxygalactose transaminase
MEMRRATPSNITPSSDSGGRRIPFLDLQVSYEELKEQYDAAYSRVMHSGHYILGEEVEAFEAEFAAYCGSKYCVAVANGSEALFLILRALEIGASDEVLVPGNTAIQTWLAVSQTGAKPVPVDPTLTTYNIDWNCLANCLTQKTRAIIAVHLYGQPADMDEIRQFASQHSLRVIEDAAQAHGARYRGTPVGNLSDAAAFSFYPTKNLGAFGDGGAVLTNDEHIADCVRLLHNYGSQIKNINTIQGYNSRLDPLQAAFLRVRLQHLDEWNLRRKSLAQLYLNEIGEAKSCGLPEVPFWAQPVWHQFVIRHSDREHLRSHLLENGIETLIHYPIPPHLSQAYSGEEFNKSTLARSEELANSVLSLPMNPHLQPDDVIRIGRTIREFGD